MILGWLVGFGWFAFYLVGHVLIFRKADIASRARRSQQLLLVGLAGAVASSFGASYLGQSEILVHGAPWLAMLCGALTFVSLFCLYTPFYYVVTSSLSVQTMVGLLTQPNRQRSLNSLRADFASERFVRQRLDTMLFNGFVRHDTNSYFTLTPKGRWLAIVFAALKNFWKLGSGG